MDTPTVLERRTDIAALLRESQAAAAAVVRLCGGEDAAVAATMADRPALKALPSYATHDLSADSCAVSAEAAAAVARFQPLSVQAPMVRCSRPAFRHATRLWGTDINYTHMLIADSIARSAEARRVEHQVYAGESRLVAQMAATDGPTAARAAELLSTSVDAVDLNCGCPQRWAMKEGFGAALMEKPELVADMVGHIRRGGRVPAVVKMRVHGDDYRRTVDWARMQEQAGAAWITVHGRTATDPPSCPVRWEAIRLVRESVGIPVVVNGGVEDRLAAKQLALRCGTGAVMAARGLLTNPALFDAAAEAAGDGQRGSGSEAVVAGGRGVPLVPLEALSDYVRLSLHYGGQCRATQLHLAHMLHDRLAPSERLHMSQLRSDAALLSALRRYGLYVDTGRWVPGTDSAACVAP